jgi:hypothetical protein
MLNGTRLTFILLYGSFIKSKLNVNSFLSVYVPQFMVRDLNPSEYMFIDILLSAEMHTVNLCLSLTLRANKIVWDDVLQQSTRWRWVVTCTLGSLYPCNHMVRNWLRLGRGGEEKILCPVREVNPGLVAHSQSLYWLRYSGSWYGYSDILQGLNEKRDEICATCRMRRWDKRRHYRKC